MAVLGKGTDFGATEQITSTKLDNLVDAAKFVNSSGSAVTPSGTGTCTSGGGLEISSATGQIGISDSGVTTAKINNDAVDKTKIDFIADDLATTDTHILIADGTDFHNKAVSGDITITNAGVVSISASTDLPDGVDAVTQSAGDNTTKVATTEFVTTATAANVTKIAKYTLTNQTNFVPTGGGTLALALSETSDPYNLATVSGGNQINIAGGSGIYVVVLDADVAQSAVGGSGSNTSRITYNLVVAGDTAISLETGPSTGLQRMFFTHYFPNLDDGDVIKFNAVSSGGGTSDSRGTIQNSQILIQKLS